MSRMEEHPTVINYYRSRDIDRPVKKILSPSGKLDAGWLRDKCLEAGADDAGFVGIDRPELARIKTRYSVTFPVRGPLLASYVK